MDAVGKDDLAFNLIRMGLEVSTRDVSVLLSSVNYNEKEEKYGVPFTLIIKGMKGRIYCAENRIEMFIDFSKYGMFKRMGYKHRAGDIKQLMIGGKDMFEMVEYLVFNKANIKYF